MAEFIPIRTVQDKLDSISIVNGQVIFVVDTKKIFIDIDEKTRKEIGGVEGADFLSKIDPVATGSFGLNYDEDYTLGGGSVAAGDATIAEAECSFAFGSHTYAASPLQTVVGRYNIVDDATKFALIVGNGTSDAARKNIFTLDWQGNINIEGTITDGKGNSLNEVLNFDTLSRMMTSGENNGINITEGILENGEHCFNFTITSLPKIEIDADGYWLMDGVRITNVDGQQVQARGLSAYEIAVLNGFSGTELEWLQSLKGEPGVTEVQITTQKRDISFTLKANSWNKYGGPPYRQDVIINGITKSMNPRVDIVISEDLSTGKMELNEYCNITKITTDDGKISAYCYRVPPSIDLNLQIEVI